MLMMIAALRVRIVPKCERKISRPKVDKEEAKLQIIER